MYKEDVAYIHNELSFSHKKREMLPFATTWKDLEGIMFSEISQVETDKYYIILLICRVLKKWTNRYRVKNTHRWKAAIDGGGGGGVWYMKRGRWSKKKKRKTIVFYMDINSETSLFSQCMKHVPASLSRVSEGRAGSWNPREAQLWSLTSLHLQQVRCKQEWGWDHKEAETRSVTSCLSLDVITGYLLYLKNLEFIMHFFQI